MSPTEHTVAEFGRSLGLDHLNFSPRGQVALEIQGVGTCVMEEAGPRREAVLLSLARAVPPAVRQRPQAVLALSHFHSRTGAPLHAGVSGDRLVFAAVIPAEDFTLPRIHELLDQLEQRHRAAEGAA